MAHISRNSGFPGKQFQVAEHDLNILHQPQDRLDAMLQMVASAQQSVQMFFYMFGDDGTGREVNAALVAAAARGVKVQLIIDSFGSANISDRFFDQLIAAGGHYHCFSTRKGLGYLIRNHQKMLIIDRQTALVGGFNITDQYFGRAGDESWEDLGLMISGPEVPRLATYFDDIARSSQDGKVRYRDIRRTDHAMAPRHWRSAMVVGRADQPDLPHGH